MKIKIIIILSLAFFGYMETVYSSGSTKPKPKAPTYRPPSTPFVNNLYSPCVDDVQGKLDRMNKSPRIHKYRINSGVFYSFNYRMHLFNKNTLGLENHIQGLAKLKGNHNFVFSGGDFKRREAHLFVINNGRVIRKMTIKTGNLWHPTGIHAAGDVLLVPLEAYKTGSARLNTFYDIRDPKNLRQLPLSFDPQGGAASQSLHRRRSDGKYILGAGYGLFISKTSNIMDGFGPRQSLHGVGSAGQSQSLIEECSSGNLYLVTFSNSGPINPVVPGKDKATLYRIDLNEYSSSAPRAHKIKEYTFKCYYSCNFAAGTTLLEQGGGGLKIYSVPHYRKNYGRKIYIGEFK